jgi:hypothetical protein
MKRYMIVLVAALIAVFPLWGQYADQLSAFNKERLGYEMSGSQSRAAFLDWSRLEMRHSVSMSVGGSAMGSSSFLTYHNQLFMPLSSKLSFYGNLYWQMQTHASHPALSRINSPAGAVYFDASLNYELGENSSISLGVSRYPADYNPYWGYSSYYSPYYRNLQSTQGGLP